MSASLIDFLVRYLHNKVQIVFFSIVNIFILVFICFIWNSFYESEEHSINLGKYA